MDVLQKFLNWVSWYPGQFAAGMLLLVQLWWFELSPPGWESEQGLSVVLLALYMVLLVLALRTKRALVRSTARAFALLFLVLNAVYDTSYLPSIETVARFGGTTYLVTSNPEFLGWGIPYRRLVEWKSPLQYEIHALGYSGPDYKMTYDSKNGVLNLVNVNNMLFYSDDGTFRNFQGDVLVGSDRYYMSEQCNTVGKDYCATTTYTMYKCQSDNTSCVALPMTYTGEDGYTTLQLNKSTGNIDFYTEPNSSTTSDDILIYSYGREPRCYVAGCSIQH